MTGSFLLDPNLDVAFALERNNPRLERTLPTGSKAHLAQQIRDFGWEIGEHSYGLPLVYAVDGNNKLKIGRFCSIGQAVTIVLVNHRSDFVSTYPFSTYRHVWPSAPILEDYVGKGDVIIGNDVWIGHGVFIASGVKIGDGAIIGGQSVVTKDVPAYAVVAGNPSRILRYRFPMPIIEELLEIKWWYWPDDRLERSLPFMMSGDVRAFVEHARGS
ncbi:CatB-related O-acetyltransferase [Lichenicoccus roseus]|uniref:CatB-related O-acetyltransferase n=2 Tax=Lichenicoccus roseus TaxID=2683649 RepID=A0A5R9J269_9PROT|nr:CatB-related O-acetyltransferase [Lichenicoccus roseus]